MLALAQRRGDLLVTTTRRLLGYRRARDRVRLTATDDAQGLRVDVAAEGAWNGGDLPHDLEGLCLYVDRPDRTRLFVGGREVAGLHCNPPDESGRPSVSLPWRRLEFPTL